VLNVGGSEPIVIDFSNIPLKPIGKKEIQQLEMALIIGTLYRPEILELIRDPVERATWIDSLAIAVAAFARYKAGIPISEIAQELGRSEVTIRGHLNQKTKAGKLVAETFEKIKRGELKITIPFLTSPMVTPTVDVERLRSELESLREDKKLLEEKIQSLHEELEKKSKELETLRNELKKKEEELQAVSQQLTVERGEAEKLKVKLNELINQIRHIRDLASEIVNAVNKLLE
jgi:probable regulatory domain-containing protein